MPGNVVKFACRWRSVMEMKAPLVRTGQRHMRTSGIAIACWVVLAVGCMHAPHRPGLIETFKPEIAGAAERRQMLVGRWYEEQPLKEGGRRQSLVEHFADGTFRIDFIMDSAKGEMRQTEAGLWGVSGPVHFTITQGWLAGDRLVPLANPADASFYDAYEILQLDEHVMRYRHYETGNEFTLRRVARDFVFPPGSS